jgi:hypothetical protein
MRRAARLGTGNWWDLTKYRELSPEGRSGQAACKVTQADSLPYLDILKG